MELVLSLAIGVLTGSAAPVVSSTRKSRPVFDCTTYSVRPSGEAAIPFRLKPVWYWMAVPASGSQGSSVYAPLPNVPLTCVIAWQTVQVIPACAVLWLTSSKFGSSNAPLKIGTGS